MESRGARPGWQGVSRRGLWAGLVILSGASLSAGVGLVALLAGSAPPWEIAAAGVSLGLLLASTAAGAAVTTVIRRHDQRAREQWEDLTRWRAGGALWKRRTPLQRSEMPGWKVARVVGDPTLNFIGLAFGRYGPVEDASCAHTRHVAPDPSCTCGFYAFYRPLRARWAWWRNRESVLLQVEGYGLAIEHELGWRAGHQEVLTVILPGRCLYCPRRTAGLIRTPLFDEWTAACTSCARRKQRDLKTPDQLAVLWGTEVAVAQGWRWGWAPPRLRRTTP